MTALGGHHRIELEVEFLGHILRRLERLILRGGIVAALDLLVGQRNDIGTGAFHRLSQRLEHLVVLEWRRLLRLLRVLMQPVKAVQFL